MAGQPQAMVLNWNLDTTAGSAIKLNTGILTAALSDNVQPRAFMVCESYGTNLPMSQAVCVKMRTLGRRSNISCVVKEIGVKVGFAPGNAADQLSQTSAGGESLCVAHYA